MIRHGDCLSILKEFPNDFIDSLVTDPPYGWRFMGKAWDVMDIDKLAKQGKRPGETYVGQDGKTRKTRDQTAEAAGKYDLSLSANQAFQAWTAEWAREVYRVLKPGAHILVFCGPRTYHRMASGVEDAGFEVRDQMQWLFGSGFPKSYNIGKSTEDPKWEGYGTALKPANEPILLARKPLSEKTVSANVLKWGTGGINIDASRVKSAEDSYMRVRTCDPKTKSWKNTSALIQSTLSDQGRFPANLLLSHNPDCVEVGVKKVKAAGGDVHAGKATPRNSMGAIENNIEWKAHGNGDGTETVTAFECTEGCAVAELDRQSLAGGMHGAGKARDKGDYQNAKSAFGGGGNAPTAHRLGDSGGASRFFYCAKSSKREKNEGCEGMPEGFGKRNFSQGMEYKLQANGSKTSIEQIPQANTHPTVKPLKLMSYLITLVTPPGGTCLDPFLGSGSTGVAAIQSGFKFIGIEREAEYIEIAKKRIGHAFEKRRI